MMLRRVRLPLWLALPGRLLPPQPLPLFLLPLLLR
jgi:hypothetical protein